MSVPLIKEFTYHATIGQVWQALIDPAKMREWYFPQLQSFEPVVGFNFQFADEGSEYQKEWVVTKVVDGQTFAHSWAYKGHPGNTEVRFDLAAAPDGTTLKVTQTGLETFPKDPHFRRERFEWGWDTLLGQNLRRLLERKAES